MLRHILDVGTFKYLNRLCYLNMSQLSSDEFEDDAVDPTEIFSLEDYLAQQNTLNNFATQIATNIHDALGVPSTRCRSAPRTYIDRKREFYSELLIADYFCDNPTYPDYYFRRRFRMGKPLFLRIVQALGEWSPYFTQRVDALGRPGLSPLQKCTSAMHMLAYSVPAEKTDDHVRLGASTTLECLENFSQGVIAKFGGEYLQRPTVEVIQRLLEIGEARGFPVPKPQWAPVPVCALVGSCERQPKVEDSCIHRRRWNKEVITNTN